MIAEQFQTHIEDVIARIDTEPTRGLFEQIGVIAREAQASNFSLTTSAIGDVWPQRKWHNHPVKDWGRVAPPGHPLLVDTGDLKASVTQQGAPGHVERFMQHEYQTGTNIEYAAYHEYGTSRMPARSFIGVADEYADQFAGPIDAWLMGIFSAS